MLDWNKLRTFFHVANAGSFSRAAEQLNITQSALSRQIIDLEQNLKTTLFFRKARGLELTKQGEVLFETASRMYTEAQNGKSLLLDSENEPKGLLKICTTPNIASMWAAGFLGGFMKMYPEIRVAVIGTTITDVLLSQADISITTLPTKQPDLIERKLISSHLKLYASQEYLDQFGTPKTVEDLDNHRIITFGDYLSHAFSNINWPLRVGCKPGQFREPYMQINSFAGMMAIASQGFGIVTLAAENPSLAKSNLVEILPDVEGPTIDTYLVYHMQLKNSKRVIAFREYMEMVIEKMNFSRPE
ncbi:MAG: LysR family transcriptional regulator [Alphaproteobacteria bacterium]